VYPGLWRTACAPTSTPSNGCCVILGSGFLLAASSSSSSKYIATVNGALVSYIGVVIVEEKKEEVKGREPGRNRHRMPIGNQRS
jgi:hypothetical protein